MREFEIRLLFNLIKCLLFITFSVMFFFLMTDVWSKYTSKMTATGINFCGNKEKEKQLPHFTFCPWPVYRTKGLYFSQEDFKKNTFDFDEMFYPVPQAEIANNSAITIKEIWSVHYGRCFTLIFKVM